MDEKGAEGSQDFQKEKSLYSDSGSTSRKARDEFYP